MKLQRKVLPKPEAIKMMEGEEVLREGEVALQKGLFFARVGRLILTNHRLMWNEDARPLWPMKPLAGHIDLRDMITANKGTFFDFIFGGRPLRLRLRNNKSKCIWDNEGRLDEWIADIRRAIANISRA
jgi:hypothetical protein